MMRCELVDRLPSKLNVNVGDLFGGYIFIYHDMSEMGSISNQLFYQIIYYLM